MRVIGLDYGSKTVGVALSDELMLTAQPLTTIHRPTKLRQTLAQISDHSTIRCGSYCGRLAEEAGQ